MRTGGKRENGDLPIPPDLKDMSDLEKATKMAQAIENITSSYKKIDKRKMHDLYPTGQLPLLSLEDVISALRRIKIPKGTHEKDPPREILLESPEIFAIPLVSIYNNCLQQGDWPTEWKKESTTLIPKKKQVKSVDDFRPIALTVTFSKCLESIVPDVIWQDIEGKLNESQYGGLRGVSTEHYLSNLYDIITNNRYNGYSSVLLSFDLKKAFNSGVNPVA